MTKPTKPCDRPELRDKLPCYASANGGECWGARLWCGREEPPRKTRYMDRCPWPETVLHHLYPRRKKKNDR